MATVKYSPGTLLQPVVLPGGELQGARTLPAGCRVRVIWCAGWARYAVQNERRTWTFWVAAAHIAEYVISDQKRQQEKPNG